jgi:hypothetical protein
MTQIRAAYLTAARSAAELVAHPAVTAAWQQPSALARMSVGAVACHLTGQLAFVARVLQDPPATQPQIPLLDYYSRVGWLGQGLDHPFHLRVQRGEDMPVVLDRLSTAQRAVSSCTTCSPRHSMT